MKRHQLIYKLIRPLVILFMKLRFGYTYEKAPKIDGNYIVISNHTTDYDMCILASSFSEQMYFVASEHVARMGFLYRILEYAFAPIMRPKGSSAAGAVMAMVRKARQGHNICLFAEGVRSWDGVTCPLPPATGRLVKTTGLSLVTYKIEGGYFASPMWSGASARRGRLHGRVVNVYSAEQLHDMKANQVQALIEQDLYEDAYARQLEAPIAYRCKHPAKNLENLMFVCPECGALDSFVSDSHTVRCTSCDLTIKYDLYGMLHGGPFRTLTEFAQWQDQQVDEHLTQSIGYTAPNATLTRINDHTVEFVCEGPMTLTADSLICGEYCFPLPSVSDLAMRNQRPIVFTVGHDYYEVIPDKGSNALKFMLYYQKCKKRTSVKR